MDVNNVKMEEVNSLEMVEVNSVGAWEKKGLGMNLHTKGTVLVKLLGMKGLEIEKKVARSGREGVG